MNPSHGRAPLKCLQLELHRAHLSDAFRQSRRTLRQRDSQVRKTSSAEFGSFERSVSVTDDVPASKDEPNDQNKLMNSNVN